MDQRILITGAAGRIGSMLRPRLARPGRTVRLLDIRPIEDPGDGEEPVLGSITDLDTMVDACRDVDAVLHLGGISGEASFEEILRHNVHGTGSTLEAARIAGVTRVVLASSNHAAGFHDRADDLPGGGLPATVTGRPDTWYGWSKVAGEAAGQLYADRFGMDVICLRIGAWSPRPRELRGLAIWLSPDDGARLVEACLSATSPGFRVVWGMSRNTRRWCSLAEGEEIGYHPKDDAEVFAQDLIARFGPPDFGRDPLLRRLGGQWCDVPLGEPTG